MLLAKCSMLFNKDFSNFSCSHLSCFLYWQARSEPIQRFSFNTEGTEFSLPFLSLVEVPYGTAQRLRIGWSAAWLCEEALPPPAISFAAYILSVFLCDLCLLCVKKENNGNDVLIKLRKTRKTDKNHFLEFNHVLKKRISLITLNFIHEFH